MGPCCRNDSATKPVVVLKRVSKQAIQGASHLRSRDGFMNQAIRSWAGIEFACVDDVAWIRLNRPRERNALVAPMREGLRAALRLAEEHCRAIVLTGAGPAFCAGHDFAAETSDDPARIWEVMVDDYAETIEAIEGCAKPTIAALNGPAIGAGVALALACDMVIARSGSFLSLPFVQMGMVPDCGSYRMLAERVGSQRAIGMALTGSRIGMEEAKAWGLVWEVVPRQDLAARAGREAGRIAALPEAAVRGLKALARASQIEDRRAWARREAQIQIDCLSGG